MDLPSVISLQFVHLLQGVAVGPFSQLSDLARIRATEVFPTPRGPENKKSVADPSLGDGVHQRPDHRLLARDFLKRLRAKFSG